MHAQLFNGNDRLLPVNFKLIEFTNSQNSVTKNKPWTRSPSHQNYPSDPLFLSNKNLCICALQFLLLYRLNI